MKFFSNFSSTGIVLSIFILDRVTKYVVQEKMFLGESREVLPFFHLTYVENTGAAFGLGQNQNCFFIIISLAILALIFFLRYHWEKSEPQNMNLKIGLALVIGGALGNLYDRIKFGSVVDFFDFFVGSYHWPAFNIADSAICVGVFLIAFSQLGRQNS